MAKSDGTVYVDTRIDTKGFGKGVNTMQKQIGGLSGAIGKLGTVIAATFAVGKIIEFGKEAIELGSDLQEVQNVVDVTFTTMSDKVNEFAKGAAEAAGLSETMAKKYMGTFGAMSKSFGFIEEEAFAMSSTLTQMVGDVASFYNLTQDEAYTKLKSVFTGETESLKDLGVVMTQSALDSYAMAKGYGKATKEMSEQEKVALRYSFVMDQLASASGDFVRTSDGWANQTRILSLSIDTLKANIGQGLINIFTPLLKIINQIVSKMAQLSQHFVVFSKMLVGKSTSGGGGSPGDALAEIEDGYADIADATDEATKAQKKYLTGLDEIRTFSENTGVDDAVGGGASGLDFANNGENPEMQESVSIIDKLKDKLEELKQQYPIFNNLFSIISNGMILLKELGTDLFNLFTQPFVNNEEGFLVAANNLVSFLGENIETVIAGIDEAVQKFKSVYENKISPVIQEVTNDISKLTEDVLKWFNEDIVPVLERWGESFGKLWEEHISPFLGNLAEFFGEVADNFNQLWHELIEPFLSWIVQYVLPMLTPVIEMLGKFVMNIFGRIADTFSALIDILSGWLTFLTGVYTLDWERAWSGLGEVVKGIANLIISYVEGFINDAIIGLNGIIGGGNTAGGFLGIEGKIPTIPELNIPRLATGAVIPPNAPFVAMLGDQKHGKNIEAPLDTIKQAVREVVGNGGGGQYAFTAQINRRTLFEEIIDEAKLRQSTSGRNPFDLA